MATLAGSKMKLTKVVSTKLSIEDYNALQTLTNITHQYGRIDEPNVSKFLRFIIGDMVNRLRTYPGFSALEQ
jgi:hypothetical protein